MNYRDKTDKEEAGNSIWYIIIAILGIGYFILSIYITLAISDIGIIGIVGSFSWLLGMAIFKTKPKVSYWLCLAGFSIFLPFLGGLFGILWLAKICRHRVERPLQEYISCHTSAILLYADRQKIIVYTTIYIVLVSVVFGCLYINLSMTEYSSVLMSCLGILVIVINIMNTSGYNPLIRRNHPEIKIPGNLILYRLYLPLYILFEDRLECLLVLTERDSIISYKAIKKIDFVGTSKILLHVYDVYLKKVKLNMKLLSSTDRGKVIRTLLDKVESKTNKKI